MFLEEQKGKTIIDGDARGLRQNGWHWLYFYDRWHVYILADKPSSKRSGVGYSRIDSVYRSRALLSARGLGEFGANGVCSPKETGFRTASQNPQCRVRLYLVEKPISPQSFVSEP